MRSDPLADFVQHLEEIVARGAAGEEAVLGEVQQAMRSLVASDDWLPDAFTRPDPVHYRQYLLHADPRDRFCVVSFVWGPGQQTPIHDHCTWGVIGMLRGAEVTTSFSATDSGMEQGEELTLQPGDVCVVSPTVGDIHQVRNAYQDRVSISIHAYGTNIGKQTRHVFDARSGTRKDFVSGYSNGPA
jgi:predicted metal-dependent enzyme (double-stranded beta helix superfamily)